MAVAPILVRTFLKSAGADADFVGTQVSPAAGLLIPVAGRQTVAVSFVPYTALGTVSTGTLDIQMVYVNTPTQANRTTLPTLVTGNAVVSALAIGIESGPYNVANSEFIFVRVASVAGLAVAADTCKIFVRPLS